MSSLFGLLCAVQLGSISAGAEPVAISVRAESRAVAAESELRPSALLDLGREWNAAPHTPEWPAALPSAPGPLAPIFHAHRPEEWISIVARQLNVADKSITQAAMQATVWFVAMPVRVDVSPRRLYITVRFRAF